ncbi:MAG: indolepyruvate ferredoxin oxidoreductase subunit alpha [Clostridia bacterium]
MKKILLGNQAIARGAYEAGATVVSAYPGTPSTEITENAVKYDGVYAEWSPNEKVAMEVAIGASIAGARCMVCMKHVGVNVAADPLFSVAYAGVNGGLVIVAADDPSMHSSQNEQDSRYYAMSAHIPMLEPSDSQEAKDFTKLAFELSEKYDTPVFVRSTTRVAHSQSFVELQDKVEFKLLPYVKDVNKYTLMPSTAKIRHIAVEKREVQLASDCETLPINKCEYNDTKLGIVCSGAVYHYVKEALPEASVYKIGMVYPMPIEGIKAFARRVDKLIVIEELEPIFERELKSHGISCEGKCYFGVQGELSASAIREKLLNILPNKADTTVPVRPPVMCAGCPHRSIFYLLNKLKLTVCADIGCYTLGAQPPLSAVDTVICMGASIGMAHGMEKARGRENTKNVVAVIGDSTFVHSGITGLINAVYNKSAITLLILDNSTTGMTGHQDHPATGKTLSGETTFKLNLEEVVKCAGVKHLSVVDAYDLSACEKAIVDATNIDEVSVVIVKRPCALLIKLNETPYCIDDCKKCGACLKIGCPAIMKKLDGSVKINAEQCVGCGVCAELCKFNAIKRIVKEAK